MRRIGLAVCLAVLAAFGPAPAFAEMLISPSEAAMPPMQGAPLAMRGITLGPSIEMVSPGPNAGTKSPLAFKIKFIPHNQTKVDLASVQVTYLKEKPVDLTQRLKPYISASGIDMTNAEVPPGVHLLRIFVKDSNGKSATSILRLTVTSK